MRVELETLTRKHIYIKLLKMKEGDEWLITSLYDDFVNAKRP